MSGCFLKMQKNILVQASQNPPEFDGRGLTFICTCSYRSKNYEARISIDTGKIDGHHHELAVLITA